MTNKKMSSVQKQYEIYKKKLGHVYTAEEYGSVLGAHSVLLERLFLSCPNSLRLSVPGRPYFIEVFDLMSIPNAFFSSILLSV